MSVLYQALKRRDQIERKATVPAGAVFAASTPKNTIWKFTMTFAVVAALGLYAYSVYRTPQAVAVPVAVAAEEPQPVLVDDKMPAKVDIDQIAAMMPDDAKLPLPSKAETAIQLHDAGEDFTSQVNRYGMLAQTEPENALPHLQRLVKQKPVNAAAHAQLALNYIVLKRFDDAEKELNVATALDPTNAQIWYNLAALADQQDHAKAALAAYENALQNAGDEPAFDRSAVQARLNYLRAK